MCSDAASDVTVSSPILKPDPIPELELAIDCGPDQKTYRRLKTIQLLPCGSTFDLTMRHAPFSERCLQTWIERFNAGGIDAITEPLIFFFGVLFALGMMPATMEFCRIFGFNVYG